MLLQKLHADWDARRANTRVAALPEFNDGALTLGAGTKLADLSTQNREAEAERAIALLSVAVGRPLDATAAKHARRALDRARNGDAPLAMTHLALAGVGRLDNPREDARRLFIADGLMKAGTPPSVILGALSDAASPSNELDRAYNPDQPRVPAGSGRPSGQWTSGDSGADEAGADAHIAQSENPPATADQGVRIADASSDWAQYLNPVGPAEAAEPGAPFNGLGPNAQHDQGVEVGKQALRDLGFQIVTDGAYAITVPGFATPRIYDYIAKNPITGELVGVEVKTTQFSTIFFNPFQVEKDVAIVEGDGVNISALDGKLTYVVYQAMCEGCDRLSLRTAYLLARLELSGVAFQYFYKIWDERR